MIKPCDTAELPRTEINPKFISETYVKDYSVIKARRAFRGKERMTPLPGSRHPLQNSKTTFRISQWQRNALSFP